MAARPSIWTTFRRNLPTKSTPLPLDTLRANIMAVLGFAAAGVCPGWNYTNSATLAEASPGTASQPARMYWTRGSGITKEWIKAAMTYDASGNPTKIALYYSSDNQGSYVAMKAEDGGYVLTNVFDASNNLQSSTWGSTP